MKGEPRVIGYRVLLVCEANGNDLDSADYLIGTIPNAEQKAREHYERLRQKHTGEFADIVSLFEIHEVKCLSYEQIASSLEL